MSESQVTWGMTPAGANNSVITGAREISDGPATPTRLVQEMGPKVAADLSRTMETELMNRLAQNDTISPPPLPTNTGNGKKGPSF